MDPAEDKALRRTYGAADMFLHKCAKLEKPDTIIGENCPAGLPIFGPYIRVPSNANVDVKFDIASQGKLFVGSDVASAGGQHFHGRMDDLHLGPNERGKVGYAVHMFQRADGVEARVGIRAEAPVSFKITNFSLTVQ